jgi:hypothetical protein
MGIEDQSRYAIPSVHVVDDEKLQGSLQEPIPPGGALPQLDLARANGIDVASGQAFQTQPEPVKPPIEWPSLNGSPECGGYDAANHSPAAPDLACSSNRVDYTPSSGPIAPDHIIPDFGSLSLSVKPYNIDAGMDFNPGGGEFSPDPDNPDLTDYNKPMGLDFYPESYANIFAPDPGLDGDATNPDVPGGIHVVDHPAEPDPPLPDLQNPQLEPQIRMAPEDRPGDIATGAMDILHNSPDYGATKGVAYDLSYMTQPGSSRRSRHMDNMLHGLDEGKY